MIISKKKVLPGFEPGSLDSKSKVLTITPQNHTCTQWDSNPRSILHQILSLTPLTAREYVLKYSHSGTRTRVAWVKTRYPNHLDYMGSGDTFPPLCMRWDLNPRSVSHQILSLTPLTRLGNPCLNSDYNESILFWPGSIKWTSLLLRQGSNLWPTG